MTMRARSAAKRAGLVGLALGCLLMSLWVTQPASADTTGTTPAGAGSVKTPGVGITVSWYPTSNPFTLNPGSTSHGMFWVTNQTPTAIPVDIYPLTARPGNNGQMTVTKGADPRFNAVVYQPSSFVAQPHTTTPVTVLVKSPLDLPPGVYLVPGLVQPVLPPSPGNVHIVTSVAALVTFKTPGPVRHAHLSPSFIGTSHRSGIAASGSFPGPVLSAIFGSTPVQVATSGSQVLRILDDSRSSFYATSEIDISQSWGQAIVEGHPPGFPSAQHNPSSLYFPHIYRDFTVVWHPTSFGIGDAHLSGYAGYQANLSYVHVGTDTTLLVVSPLWILPVALVLALVAFWVWRLRRRVPDQDEAQPRGTPAWRWALRALGSIVLLVIYDTALGMGMKILALVIGGAAVVLGAVLMVMSRHKGAPDDAGAPGWLSVYLVLDFVLIGIGALAALLGCFSVLRADLAISLLGGAALWSLMAFLGLWLGQVRRPTSEVTETDVPGAPRVVVSSAADE